jgi:hypothetical protein
MTIYSAVYSLFSYLTRMKNAITISDHFPELKGEELRAADKRRETYALARDLQAKEDNEAIARRLEKNKEKEE